ncbi:VanZ family protein [Paenarthrobacter nicotinovorans]|uniref:VanZ family protein n=1 Tax=Paenarthrobacter nicotinovorans TaxID=29320 RepID=UPI0037FF1E8A
MRMPLRDTLPWRVVLSAYVIGLGVIGFWPTPVDKPVYGTLSAVLDYFHAHGAPGWFDYHFVEGAANVGMFVPFGFLVGLALPRLAWWRLTGLGMLASACMELGQFLFLTARFASLTDIATNTLGAVVGVAAACILNRQAIRRQLCFEPIQAGSLDCEKPRSSRRRLVAILTQIRK